MRLPPQNINAEETIIASILANDKSFKTCNYLKDSDFYKTDHQIIFEIMHSLAIKQSRIDILLVGQELIKKNREDIARYLSKVYDNATIYANLESHAKIIKSESVKRALLNSLSTINEKIYSDDIEKTLDFAQSEILGYKVTSDQGNIHHIRDLVNLQIDIIERKQTHENLSGIKTGFSSIDKYLDLEGAIYSIIAARPSMGKTAFALTIIRNMAMAGEKPGILSLEMGNGKLINRWLSMLTGINTMNFNRFNALKSEDWQNIKDAAGEIYDLWDVLISDAPARSIETIERQARQMVSDGVNVLFIDQLNQIGGLTDDDVKNFTKHSHRISQLKKELNIPIFLLAQLNRKVEDRSNKEPRLSDLKMSGSLEEDPDIVFLLYRPEYYETDKAKKIEKARDVVVNIAKNRDGATYREKDVIVFDKARTLFEEDFSRIQQYR
jgi:replicative DNA helicase